MPTVTAQPLTHCPVCNYDLTGLPKNHRCPECGFEYDETTVTWNVPLQAWWTDLAYGFALLVWTAVMVINLSRAGTGRGGPSWFTVAIGIFIPPSVIISVIARRRGAGIILTQHRIVVLVPLRRPRSIGWGDLNFTVPGRMPQWRVPRRWPRPFGLPTYAIPECQRYDLLVEIYDRWKRFQESQPADSPTNTQNPER